MDLRALRKRCEARLLRLDLPIPFDVQSFCERVAANRGRPILLYPVRSEAGPFGLWVAGPSLDVVFYEEETSPLHQDHIILHEVGHMISQHRGRCVLSQQRAQRIAPDLTPVALAHLLDCSGAQTEEQEAETIAVLIHQQTRIHPEPAIDVLPPAADERLARVAQIFGL